MALLALLRGRKGEVAAEEELSVVSWAQVRGSEKGGWGEGCLLFIGSFVCLVGLLLGWLLFSVSACRLF